MVGYIPFDIAQTKVYPVRALAKENGFPLLLHLNRHNNSLNKGL